ncbi:MAG: hypothetical protein ABIC40_05205 [bacterium]
MIKTDCAHLKRVTNNDIHEGNRGTLRCDVHRAAPDPSMAGIACPHDCMGYRAIANGNKADSTSFISSIKRALFAMMGRS